MATTRAAAAAAAAAAATVAAATEADIPTISEAQLIAVGYTREEFTALEYSAAQINTLIKAADNIIAKKDPLSPTKKRQLAFDTTFMDPTTKVIAGFNDDKPISRLQNAFRMVLMELGINRETAEELFRHGYHSFETLKGLDHNGIKGIISGVNKYKHGKCPDPDAVFIGRRFAERMHLLVSWVEFLPTIGDVVSASGWNEIAEEWTKDRLRSIKEDDELEAAGTLDLPETLTKMSNFRKFDEQLREYLRHKRGVTKAPLLYLLREPDQVEVDDNDRGGHVGHTDQCDYPDWASYYIRCTVHEGRHYQKDNTMLWSILFRLVGSGPGWSFIQSYGSKSGSRGDGRSAYYALHNQAYEKTNVRFLCEEQRSFIKNSSFTGHSQRYTFDRHKQLWFEAKETLTRFDRAPREEEFVLDFCNSVSDPRLEQAVSVILADGSPYLNNFEKASHYMSQTLGIKELQASCKRSSSRNVSTTRSKNQAGRGSHSGRGHNASKRPKYTGPLRAQYYDRKTWLSMTPEQKSTVLKLKEERDAASPAPKKKVKIATTTATTEHEPTTKKGAGDQFGSKAHNKPE